MNFTMLKSLLKKNNSALYYLQRGFYAQNFLLLISALLFCSFLGAYEHPSFEPLFSIEDVFHTDTAPEVYSADEVFEWE